MRIQKVLPTLAQEKATYKNNRNTKFVSLAKDTVSFKGGVSASLVYLVIKEGYKGLKTNTERARFKTEIAKKMAAPNLSDNAKQLVDVLFALSKTKGKDEPSNMLYGLNDKYDSSKTLKTLRSEAVGKLFPLIPVMKSDINSGNAAKTAMLESMIDSGEYLESPYIYNAFYSLFNDSAKESLVLKAMRDKNVWREINETYVLPEAKERAENSYKMPEDTSTSDSFFHFLKVMFYDLPRDMIKEKQHVRKELANFIPEVQKEYNTKRAIVNATLVSMLDINKHHDFFSSYKEIIKEQSTLALQSVTNKLKQNYEGKQQYNALYEKYANGLEELSIPEEHIAIKYLVEVSGYYKNDKEKLETEFCTNSNLCDDIIKDFELLSKSSTISNINEVKPLFKERIDEKISSDNKLIQKSAGTLIYLSGRANELKSLLDSDKLGDARSVLKSKMQGDSIIYGCKEPHIPTLAELEKEAAERREAYRNSESSLTESDIEIMEARMRMYYL